MDKNTISRVSRRYKNLLLVLFFCLPVSYAALWAFAGQLPKSWFDRDDYIIVGTITPLMSFLGFIVSMLKGTVIMYIIRTLKRLFGWYEQGVFFSGETVACFRHLSAALIWWVVAGLISSPLMSMVLTMNNPVGQRSISLTFQSADLTALIIGGVLSVIAKVMESGRRLQEEMELTI
jgi:hypothetical protein